MPSVKVGHPSKTAQEKRDSLKASNVELSSEGYSQREIAQKLQVGKSAVNRDLVFLRNQARENLQHHIHDRIPEEYQNCMIGMKRNLRQTLEIAEATSDPKTKLQARAIANYCYKYIMELTAVPSTEYFHGIKQSIDWYIGSNRPLNNSYNRPASITIVVVVSTHTHDY